MELQKFDGDKSEWVTPEDGTNGKPDPDLSNFDITGYNILIRPVEPSDKIKTASGVELYMPDSTRDDIHYLSNVGRVIGMGPLAYLDPETMNRKDEDLGPYGRHGVCGSRWCEVGDYVVWGRNQGTKIKIQEVACLLLPDDKILFRMDNPGSFDISYNVSPRIS